MTTADESFAVYLAGEQLDDTEIGMTYIHVKTPIGDVRMTREEAGELGSALTHAAQLDLTGEEDEDR